MTKIMIFDKVSKKIKFPLRENATIIKNPHTPRIAFFYWKGYEHFCSSFKLIDRKKNLIDQIVLNY